MGSRRREDAPPRPPEVDILTGHDAVTTNSWIAQHTLVELVNQDRHDAHTASLDELPETARPPGPDEPLGGREAKTLAKAGYRSLEGAGATACLRARATDSLRFIPATEFVSIGRCFMGIDDNVAVRCPCCDATDVNIQHARICTRAGTQ